MPDNELIGVWDSYYTTEADTAIKDRPFFDLEVRAIVERTLLEIEMRGAQDVRVLELGSGTGYLAGEIATRVQASGVQLILDGVDFSEAAVARAMDRNLPGCTFHTSDFVDYLKQPRPLYDMIVTQRSIMAVMEVDRQMELLGLIRDSLTPSGVGLLSEGSMQGLSRLNSLRADLGLAALEKVWHSRYLDEEAIDSVFETVETEHFAGLYWLITRVIYPDLAEPQHNTDLHRFAATLPQEGDFSPVRIFIVRR